MNTIIILENMPYARYRLKYLLENNGIKVVETSNSLDFFNKLYEKKKNIKLIVLDVNLYGEDGLYVINKIKERKFDIPIIVVTSENKKKKFIKCVQSGVIDYILKPYENDMLVNRVLGCIKTGGKWAGRISEARLNEMRENEIKEAQGNEEVKELGKDNIQEEDLFEKEDFKKYLQDRINKIDFKEHEKVIIFLIAFVKSKTFKEKVEVKKEYILLNKMVYKKLDKSFYKPNKLFRIGFSIFAAVLPNSNREKVNTIEKYIDRLYTKLKFNDVKFKQYSLKYSKAICEGDVSDANELIKIAENKLKENIERR